MRLPVCVPGLMDTMLLLVENYAKTTEPSELGLAQNINSLCVFADKLGVGGSTRQLISTDNLNR